MRLINISSVLAINKLLLKSYIKWQWVGYWFTCWV